MDIAVVETGMGGTLDATNVLDSSHLALAVITALGACVLAAPHHWAA